MICSRYWMRRYCVQMMKSGQSTRTANIYIIDGYDKPVDDEGYLYCVSTSEASCKELYAERNKLRDERKIA